MNAVDKFVVYDEIQYTKRGWINRNKYLFNGKTQYFTLPLKKDSDYLNINERYLADDFQKQNKKQFRKIENAYKKAPYYNETMSLLSDCLLYNDDNLFNFILNSINKLKNYIGIKTEIIISSNIEKKNTDLKGTERVINICKLLSANTYINPFGGKELYNKKYFKNSNIDLYFLRPNLTEYKQFNSEFIPGLSILDVLMFNSPEAIREMLDDYELE
jgi:hypothetical protein